MSRNINGSLSGIQAVQSVGSGSSLVSGTTNQVVSLKSLTSDGTIVFTPSANSLQLSASGVEGTLENIGAGAQVFKQTIANNSELRTLTGTDGTVIVTQNSGEIDFAVNASSSNTVSTLVLRDGSGNFAANAITVNQINTDNLNHNANSVIALNSNISDNGQGYNINLAGTVDATLKNSAFNVAGVVHNDSTGLFSSSLVVNADVSASAAIADTKLGTISTAGKVSNSATTANTNNSTNTIVLRDGSGDFTGHQISCSILATDLLMGAAISSISLHSELTDDSTGRTITMSGLITGSGLKASSFGTAGIVHNDNTGLFSSGLIVNADVDPSAAIVDTKLATISTASKVSNSATTATSSNTASAIVARGASGEFSCGVITIPSFSTAGVIHNNSSGVTSSSLIVNADVDPSAAIVDTKLATISTASKVSNSATTATSANTNSAIVARDGSGNFSASTITATGLTNSSFGTAGVVHNNSSGVFSSSLIVDADITSATISNAKLATATTSSASANSVVLRDAGAAINCSGLNSTLVSATQGFQATLSARQSVIPTNAGSVTLSGVPCVQLKPAGAVATYQITFPSLSNGVFVDVFNATAFDVTSITWLGTGGVTVVNGPSSLGPSSKIGTRFYYNNSDTFIYCIY